MRLFEGFFSSYVLDAEGRPRRLYPLWAWWRSPWLRRDVPRGVYEAICAEALRRSKGAEERSAGLPAGRLEPAWATWTSRIIVSGMVLYYAWAQVLSWSFLSYAVPTVAAFLVFWALFMAPASSRLGRLRGRWVAPVLAGSDDAIAGAMVANGRCASCAQQLDFTVEESPEIVRCHECGAAWRTAAVVGGDVSLGPIETPYGVRDAGTP